MIESPGGAATDGAIGIIVWRGDSAEKRTGSILSVDLK
jgi:hypothetical protein